MDVKADHLSCSACYIVIVVLFKATTNRGHKQIHGNDSNINKKLNCSSIEYEKKKMVNTDENH